MRSQWFSAASARSVATQLWLEEEAATKPRANGRRRQALTRAGGMGGEEGEEGREDDLMWWSARWRSAHPTLLVTALAVD
jgi:hypothetical protein